ncbi:hypothetical protein BOW53_03345 [Solemya pervernicosa gill symbiont]|uniref:Uncharacterized protein n=2 Tax=Gammaproteobacteria incertae sedis TaxID=118884 RepID=A0A1T2L8W7_9GAMM|nr:hypothetical protein [Candidatus Reidiella endopervernicosa]OOZ41558.1 hypothetical protein BOW53_03345 [Solemya pervernicosa gill symbiont]QKQ27966.1 hypothetical protein HUE57_18000 [Candidatus Reidiella endopervernicosa]
MSTIPDFNDSDLWTIKSTLQERYGHDVELELAETELRLNPSSTEMVPCPTVYWHYDNCNFIICKTGDERFRAQFFFRVHQQYGTGVHEFDNLADCTVTLLQVQADHDKNLQDEAEKESQK